MSKSPIGEVIMASMGKKPMPGMKDMPEESMEMSDGEAIAQDVMDAFAAKDAKMLAEALEAAFMHFDSKPHEEGEHMEEKE